MGARQPCAGPTFERIDVPGRMLEPLGDRAFLAHFRSEPAAGAGRPRCATAIGRG